MFWNIFSLIICLFSLLIYSEDIILFINDSKNNLFLILFKVCLKFVLPITSIILSAAVLLSLIVFLEKSKIASIKYSSYKFLFTCFTILEVDQYLSICKIPYFKNNSALSAIWLLIKFIIASSKKVTYFEYLSSPNKFIDFWYIFVFIHCAHKTKRLKNH